MALQKIISRITALYILLAVKSGFSQTTPDPGLAGPYAVSVQYYNLGDLAFTDASFPYPMEVRGSVHYPTSLTGGPFPVLVFLHGRHETTYQTSNPSNTTGNWPPAAGYQSITSFEGYDYQATQMASHGYIVISISANAINADDNSVADRGMSARAALLQHHLDLWNTWNTTCGAPFGTTFIGQLDMNNIGTMGHSRGGEGVVEHALLNMSLGSPYGIKAVLTLAPVDFHRKVLNGIPTLNIAPYCDGDVSDLQGLHYYDDERYADLSDETPKHSILMMGANHNFFSTVWTPGSYIAGTSDDWDDNYGSGAAHCGTGSASSKRLTPAEQQAAYNTYASAFFRIYIGGENVFRPILEVDDVIPPASSTLDSTQVFVSYHPPASKRMDVNRTDSEGSEITNSLGASASQVGLAKYDVCADDLTEIDCSVSSYHDKEPHSGSSSTLGMAQLGMRWNNTTDSYLNTIPPADQDVSTYSALQFRTTIDYSESTSGQPLNFTVQLMDGFGGTSNLLVNNYNHVLFWPPGSTFATTPKDCFNTVKIPLADFTGVDLHQITGIQFLYDQPSPTTGSIYITDLAFTGYVPLPTSAASNPAYDNLSIYPNPTEGLINVNLGSDYRKVEKISLYDIEGRKVYVENNINEQKLSIDLGNYGRGLYFLNVITANEVKNYKVVKK